MRTADESSVTERLTGVRTDLAAAPAEIHTWIEQTLGAPVVEVRPRIGGLSPAVAVSLRAANGARAFVKAVGAHINPDTPTHFRHEVSVLSALPPAPYRASLLSTYDDGHWVAIAMEDVDGRHPDWRSTEDRSAVLAAVQTQARELTPAPAGLPPQTTRAAIEKYVATMQAPAAAELAALPEWTRQQLPRLTQLAERCLDHQRAESFCHWDLRYDNLLVRHDDGQPVLLDWGMSRRGPHWGDTVVFALEWVDTPLFDEIVATAGLSAEETDDVTGFIGGLGCYLTMTSALPAPPGLPTMPAFRRQLGLTCLDGVRRRLT